MQSFPYSGEEEESRPSVGKAAVSSTADSLLTRVKHFWLNKNNVIANQHNTWRIGMIEYIPPFLAGAKREPGRKVTLSPFRFFHGSYLTE